MIQGITSHVDKPTHLIDFDYLYHRFCDSSVSNVSKMVCNIAVGQNSSELLQFEDSWFKI